MKDLFHPEWIYSVSERPPPSDKESDGAETNYEKRIVSCRMRGIQKKEKNLYSAFTVKHSVRV